MREVPRSTIERVAHIIGGSSAAQQALDEADRRHEAGESVAFFLHQETIFVGPPMTSFTTGGDHG